MKLIYTQHFNIESLGYQNSPSCSFADSISRAAVYDTHWIYNSSVTQQTPSSRNKSLGYDF